MNTPHANDLCESRATHHFPVITDATSNPISIRSMLQRGVCAESAESTLCVCAILLSVCHNVCVKTEIVSTECACFRVPWQWKVCVCAHVTVSSP